MRRRMLLIEDNEDDIELTVRALQKNQLENELVISRTGKDALAILHRTGDHANDADEPPEVVLLDLNLPGMSGLEILKAIRADERTRLIPVIVLTSSSQDKDMVESYKLGANSYVQKPIDFADFLEATRQLGMYWLVLNRHPGPRAAK